MDELFFNKIAGAVLATALGFMGIREVAHIVTHPHSMPEGEYAYMPWELETGESGGEVEIVDPYEFERVLAVASTSRGENVFKKCQACHTVEKGGSTGTGPNLYGIVGQTGGEQDFPYSNAMNEMDMVWDFKTLDRYLEKPSGLVNGTAMTFAGLTKIGQRADVIAYLNSYSDTPLALPVLEELPPIPTAESLLAETITEEGVAEDGTIIVDMPEGAAEDIVEDLITDTEDAVDGLIEDAETVLENVVEEITDEN